MLISELSQKTGISIDTIRFYEKQGLLHEEHFTQMSNRYRQFNEATIERLSLIQKAQLAGITLNEMQQSIDKWENGDINSEDQLDFFYQKLQKIDERIIALQQIRSYLQQKLENIEIKLEKE